MTERVQTRVGAIEGISRRDHVAFLGIPFAAPPVGNLRFRAPEPAAAWTFVREAKKFSPTAMQGASFAPGTRVEGNESEDCLYLNVFTPAADGKRRPVLVWIHGGAFVVGTASIPLYDGGALAALGDAVVVTLNYRLGALGFLALGEDGQRWGAQANLGLLDQLCALRWVREHIAEFGGDPENVTLFGESAGGASVSLLMLAPAAQGLFRRAIVQSGTGPLSLPRVEDAARNTDAFLGALGITRAQSERLQRVPVAELMRAQCEVEKQVVGWPHFFPVQDGVLFPKSPAELIKDGIAKGTQLLTGTNRDEWNLFAAHDVPAWLAPMDLQRACAELEARLPRRARGAVRELLETYRASREARGLPHHPRALVDAILGDSRFRIPSLRFVEAHMAAGGSAHMYLFTYGSPGLRGALGACHALELPFVFGTLSSPGQDRFAGTGPKVEALSRHMMQAWLAFARSGDPSAAPLSPWPAYDTETRPTMLLDLESSLAQAPFDEERAAWDGLL